VPISALVGLEKYHEAHARDRYSGTFLAKRYRLLLLSRPSRSWNARGFPVWLLSLGISVYANVTALIQKSRLTEYISLYGPMELNRVKFKNNGVQSLFIQEMAKEWRALSVVIISALLMVKPSWISSQGLERR